MLSTLFRHPLAHAHILCAHRFQTGRQRPTNRNISRKSLTLALSTLSNDTRYDPSAAVSTSDSSEPSDPPVSAVQLPPEIIDYVDAARNPDIYTREFVELVQRGNQDLKGKKEAFASFRDVLAREMRSAMPECRGEVDRVVRATGGTVPEGDGESGEAK